MLNSVLSNVLLYCIVTETHREQRIAIKLCFKSGINGADMYKIMKTVYGNACLACSNISEWFCRFQEGHKSVEDEARAGRPRTSQTVNNIKRVHAVLKTDRQMSIRMLADDLNITKKPSGK